MARLCPGEISACTGSYGTKYPPLQIRKSSEEHKEVVKITARVLYACLFYLCEAAASGCVFVWIRGLFLSNLFFPLWKTRSLAVRGGRLRRLTLGTAACSLKPLSAA